MPYFPADSPVFRYSRLAHPRHCATCGAPPKHGCVTSAGRRGSSRYVHRARYDGLRLRPTRHEVRVVHVQEWEDIPPGLIAQERAAARADLVTALTRAGVAPTRASRLALKVVPMFAGVIRPAGPGRWRNVA